MDECEFTVCDSCGKRLPTANLFLHAAYCNRRNPVGVDSAHEDQEIKHAPAESRSLPGEKAASDEYSSLSVRELKCQLDMAGIPHADCSEKHELVSRLKHFHSQEHTISDDEALARQLQAQLDEEAEDPAAREAREAAESADGEYARRLQQSLYTDINEDHPPERGGFFSPEQHIQEQLGSARHNLYGGNAERRSPEDQARVVRARSAIDEIQHQLHGREEFLHRFLRSRSRMEDPRARRVRVMRGDQFAVSDDEDDRPAGFEGDGDFAEMPFHHRGGDQDPMQDLFRALLPLMQGNTVVLGDGGMTYEQLMELQERIGGVDRGADQATINENSATETFEPKDGETVPTCTVCMSDLERGDKMRVLPCAHKFHPGCVDQWLQMNKTCPVCKHEIDA